MYRKLLNEKKKRVNEQFMRETQTYDMQYAITTQIHAEQRPKSTQREIKRVHK